MIGLSHSRRFTIGVVVVIAATAIVAHSQRKQTLAPHELNSTDAPPAIIWDTPAVPDGSVKFDSAEERDLRAVVLAKGFEQPWSIAFLPGGDILVTERPGRLRIIRQGKLLSQAVEGVPQPLVDRQAGLLEVMPHPNFATNRLLYISYSKPLADGKQGTTAVIRGRFENELFRHSSPSVSLSSWRAHVKPSLEHTAAHEVETRIGMPTATGSSQSRQRMCASASVSRDNVVLFQHPASAIAVTTT